MDNVFGIPAAARPQVWSEDRLRYAKIEWRVRVAGDLPSKMVLTVMKEVEVTIEVASVIVGTQTFTSKAFHAGILPGEKNAASTPLWDIPSLIFGKVGVIPSHLQSNRKMVKLTDRHLVMGARYFTVPHPDGRFRLYLVCKRGARV